MTDPKVGALEEAQSVAGNRVVFDEAELLEVWSQLLDVSGVTANPGASTEQLDAFEKVSGFPLPDELQTLLAKNNGAPSPVCRLRSFMSIEEIITEWSNWKAVFDDFDLDDLTDHYKTDGDETIAFYTTPYWVPILEEATGNFVALDMIPGPGGHKGQIVYFGADQHTIRSIAPNLTELLRTEISEHESDPEGDDDWILALGT